MPIFEPIKSHTAQRVQKVKNQFVLRNGSVYSAQLLYFMFLGFPVSKIRNLFIAKCYGSDCIFVGGSTCWNKIVKCNGSEYTAQLPYFFLLVLFKIITKIEHCTTAVFHVSLSI